jgi:hypothetical protein
MPLVSQDHVLFLSRGLLVGLLTWNLASLMLWTVSMTLPFNVANELFLRELTRPFQKQILPNKNFRHYHLSTNQLIPRKLWDLFEQNHPYINGVTFIDSHPCCIYWIFVEI